MEPGINFDAAGGVDIDRLERSLALKGQRVGEGRYHFIGGAQEHWVDLYTANHPRCDCGDHLWRERICKHILAALLREGNERVVRALGGVVERLRTSEHAAA
jgi:SWIM zinc finger